MSRMPLAVSVALLVGLLVTIIPGQAQNDDPEKLLTFANGLFDREMYPQALEQYQAFIAKFPQHANMSVALLRGGECLYHQQNYAEAIKLYDRCAKEHATSPEADSAFLRDGQCHFQLKQYSEALASFAALLQQFPQSRYLAQAAYWQGESYFSLGEYAKAIDAYKVSLEKSPKDEYSAYALYSIGLCETQLGNAEAAIASLKRVLTDYPTSPLVPEVSYRIGQALWAQKKYDEAIQNYKTVTDKYPKAPAAALAAIGIGYCLYDKANYAEAVAAFQQVAQTYPDTPQALEAQVQIGHCLLRQQKYDEALAAFGHVADNEKAGSAAQDASFWRAVTLQRKGDADAALAAFGKFVKDNPKSQYLADSYLHIGDLQLNANDPGAAATAYAAAAEATQDADTKRKARYGVAIAKFKQTPSDTTVAEVEKIIAENPKTELAAQLSLEVAQTRYTKEQYAEAAKAFDSFVTDWPEAAQAADAAYFAAVCYEKLKRTPEAVAAYERVVQKYPKGRYADQALGALINLYAAAGDTAKANQAAQQLREQYPQSKAISAGLFNSARALYEAKKYAEAAKQYDDVIKSNPAPDLAAQAWYGLGAARFADGDLEGALTAFGTVADKFPQAEIAKSLPDALFQIGEKRFDAKNYTGAQSVYQDIIKRFPDAKATLLAHYKLGWALLKQDRKQDALPNFLAVTDADADRAVVADARYQAARVLFEKPDYEKVAALLAPFIQGRDDLAMTPWALVLLGRARLELKQVAPALEAFKAVAARFPKHAAAAPAQLGLGRALKSQKDYAGAVVALNQALARNVTAVSVEAQYELADCKRLQEDLKGAAEEFLKVAILYDNPQWGANAQVQAGACYERAGDKENAVKAYKLVVDKYKDQTDAAQQAQDRLKVLGQ